MKSSIIQSVKKITYKLYFLIFKVEPGEFSRKMIKNLFFAFFGVGGATIITAGVNILAVRYLGPTEYGKINLIVSAGEFIAIPMLWGLSTAALRYLGARKEKSKEIIGTTFNSVLMLCLVFSVFFVALKSFVEPILKIPDGLYFFSIVYAVSTALFYIFQSFFQGSDKYKNLSFAWLASSFVFLITVFYFLVIGNFTFKALFLGNIFRLSFVVIVGLVVFRKLILNFDKKIFREIFSYGSFNMLSVFAGFFSLGNLDNLMINYYLGATAVGIYSAYYMIFNVFIGKVLNTVSQVFLPMSAGYDNINVLYQRVKTLIRKSFFFIVFGNFLFAWLLFKLYGQAFHFDYRLAMLVAISISLYFAVMMFSNIVLSFGVKGSRAGVLLAVFSAGINVALNILLIPLYEIYGVVIGTIMTNLILISLLALLIKKEIKNNYEHH